MTASARRIIAVVGGIVAGLGIGGLLSVTLGYTPTNNPSEPIVPCGIAIGLGVGMLVAAAIGPDAPRP
jgi:hypothetical protein